jgi:acetyl-CoA synthetase
MHLTLYSPFNFEPEPESMSDLYHPSRAVVRNANIKEYDNLYARSIADPQAFWADEAKKLKWYKKWQKVLDESNPPFYKWFTGGKINIIANAIDRHLETWRRNKLAIIWEGEPGDVRTMSYHALNREVSKFANVLKAMGVKKGEIVTIYMPQIPELVIAMLAVATHRTHPRA